MPRLTRFTNAFEELAALTPATLTRLSRPGTAYVREPKYFQCATTTVVHTDGSTFTLQSPLPTLPRIDLVKDTVHHPLFNPRISASELDENSEELLKFRRKFQSVVGDAATSSTKVAAAAAPTSTSTQEDATSTTDLLSELSFDANADGAVIVKKKVQVVAATGKKKKK